MNKKFYELCDSKKVLVAVHRGSWGGNIIENTYRSAIVARKSGGDLVEIDVIKSADGVLYAFHDGEEQRVFNTEKSIFDMTSEEIDSLEYLNSIGHLSGEKPVRLEELLLQLKGQGLINIDRCWNYLPELTELVKKLDMFDEILLKTHPTDEAFEYLSNCTEKFMYMPIAKGIEDVKKFDTPDINMVAAELIFENENDEILSEEFFDYLKSKNIKLWVNSLHLGANFNLSAGKDDTVSIENPESGWGWLIDKGFDIIQTDWPGLLEKFVKENYNER